MGLKSRRPLAIFSSVVAAAFASIAQVANAEGIGLFGPSAGEMQGFVFVPAVAYVICLGAMLFSPRGRRAATRSLIFCAVWIAFLWSGGTGGSGAVVLWLISVFFTPIILLLSLGIAYWWAGLPAPTTVFKKEVPVVEDLSHVDESLLGKCPNCKATLRLSSESCDHCGAVFGPTAAWGIEPLGSTK